MDSHLIDCSFDSSINRATRFVKEAVWHSSGEEAGSLDPVLATQDICTQKRRLKGVEVVVKQALFVQMSHVASTGIRRKFPVFRCIGDPSPADFEQRC
jgi:hypothetical protein